MADLSDQTILITGATDGLGRALAMDLAARGARLLLHGRDDARGERVLAEIRGATRDARLSWYRADFGELGQVRALAECILADESRLDVLVSNAGIGTVVPGGNRRKVSSDGYELRFAINYLAGFLLIQRLQPLLRRARQGRIVCVSSGGQAAIDFDDVMLTRNYDGVQAYCQSKLAQIMMTFDLAERRNETGVAATALHPSTYMPTKIVASPISTIEDGVRATARLVTELEPAQINGRYFNVARESRAHAQAYDLDARRTLRELSERLTGLAVVP